MNLWVDENFNDVYKMAYKVKKTLYSGQSDSQKVDVVDTHHLGKVLLNDGLLMTSERDEFVYHEMITHVPMNSHPNPKKVLIIGGGDGGTAREVLKYDVDKVVMVEIDPLVVEACKEHIKVTSCELENEKLELLIQDGVKYVKETDEKFDVVLIDSTDPIGPAAPLFNADFYNDVKNCMNENGIVVSQCENPFLALETQQALLKIKSELFENIALYNYSNITYPGGLWSFSYASNTQNPILDAKPLDKDFANDLKYYNFSMHKSSFSLPQFQKQALKELLKY